MHAGAVHRAPVEARPARPLSRACRTIGRGDLPAATFSSHSSCAADSWTIGNASARLAGICVGHGRSTAPGPVRMCCTPPLCRRGSARSSRSTGSPSAGAVRPPDHRRGTGFGSVRSLRRLPSRPAYMQRRAPRDSVSREAKSSRSSSLSGRLSKRRGRPDRRWRPPHLPGC